MSTEKTLRRPCKDEIDLTTMVVGDFGKWQLQISILMALLKLPAAWYQLNIIFMNPPQDFWCVKPTAIKCSFEEWNRISSPYIDGFPCLIFDPEVLISSPTLDRAFIPLVECQQFIFDNSTWIRTMTSEWNQVCNGHWLIHLTQCVMMWGIFVGSLVFGFFADKVGRKHTLMTAIIMQSALSFLVTISPNYYMFIVTWFVLSLASGGIGIISFVMCVEVVSGKWRTIIPVLYQLPFGIGNALMAGLAYWLRDWRLLELTLSMLSSLYISYCFFITESPRWLLATGRTEEALEVLKKVAKKNGRPFDLEKVKHLIPEPGPKVPGPNFIEFMKKKNMRLKTILLSVNWFCLGLAFYTFSQYLGTIGENIFLTVALTGIISTPGGLLCVFIITKVGRKTTIWIFQLATAFCFVFIQLIPKDKYKNDWPRLGFAGLGFAGMAGTIPSLYLYSGELYPTLGRNAGVGGVTVFARIGSMIAPLIVDLDEWVADLPLTFLAITSFAQMILIFPLPETKDYPLPETLEEAEIFTKRRRKSCMSLMASKETLWENSYTWRDIGRRNRHNKPVEVLYESVYFKK